MSRTTKKKHVFREVVHDQLVLPHANQSVVQVLAGRGNNLHEVRTPDGDLFLASMPPKFRRNVWIKRGDFVLVEPIAEGGKVKAEIVAILTRDHVEFYQENGAWPQEFQSTPRNGVVDLDDFENTNRRAPVVPSSSSESDSEPEEAH